MWEETELAIKEAIAIRPDPKLDADDNMVFLTKYGQPWVRTGPSGNSNIDKICDALNKLLVSLHLKRKGAASYALRHTFETVAGGRGDQRQKPQNPASQWPSRRQPGMQGSECPALGPRLTRI